MNQKDDKLFLISHLIFNMMLIRLKIISQIKKTIFLFTKENFLLSYICKDLMIQLSLFIVLIFYAKQNI